MKKLIMFAVATVMALNVAQAADDDKKKAPRKGRAGGIQALIKQLDLTADQKKALAKFNKENKEKGAAARKLEGKERRAAMKEIAEARNAKLKEILTEEQAKKLKELQAKAQSDRKGKKKKSEDK